MRYWSGGLQQSPHTVSYTHLIYRHTQTDTHTHTFRKMTFFHVLSVVQSESAIISNTIFFAISLRNMEVINVYIPVNYFSSHKIVKSQGYSHYPILYRNCVNKRCQSNRNHRKHGHFYFSHLKRSLLIENSI